MVDVDRWTPAHAAGLRRLSTRAAAAPAAASAARNGLISFSPLAEAVLTHLRASGVPVGPGLTDGELSRAEAALGLSFPPDLRAVLALGLPAGHGFPDWRHPRRLRAAIDIPIAAASLQIARHTFWPRSWGPRPADHGQAIRLARSNLRRAPLLIPLFDRCYIPCRPSLAGNPLFFVDEDTISCCGSDLSDFFRRGSGSDLPVRIRRSDPPSARRSLDSVSAGNPRWIEFWSDAATDLRRRNSSSSEPSSSPPDLERFVEIRPPARMPGWVGGYLDRIGSVLRTGGWCESEVSEMVEASAAGEACGKLDAEAALDALLLRAGRCSDELRRAGWSSEEVADAIGVEFRREKPRRPAIRLPPGIATKIERLAESVSGS